MKNIAAIAALTLLTTGVAFAQTTPSAGPPYVEQLPGERSNIRTVLVRFPTPSPLTADQACLALNYDAGAKAAGHDSHGSLLWVICAWRP